MVVNICTTCFQVCPQSIFMLSVTVNIKSHYLLWTTITFWSVGQTGPHRVFIEEITEFLYKLFYYFLRLAKRNEKIIDRDITRTISKNWSHQITSALVKMWKNGGLVLGFLRLNYAGPCPAEWTRTCSFTSFYTRNGQLQYHVRYQFLNHLPEFSLAINAITLKVTIYGSNYCYQ